MNKTSFRLQTIADHLGLEFQGDGECLISRVAPLQTANQGDIAFICDHHYKSFLKHTQASAVLLASAYLSDCPTAALISSNPQLDMVALLQLLHPVEQAAAGIASTAAVDQSADISASAVISDNVVIGAGVSVGAHSVVGAGCVLTDGVQVGDHCLFHPNVTVLASSLIGDRVILHSGSVIGSDGFGNARNAENHWVKVPQLGSVRLGDDVEVGANTTIDRGALEDTIIENGVRLDNQIQIGHNVQIGAHTAIAGCTGIAGSTVIGRHCMIGGGCCFNGHLTICDGAMFTGMAMVTQSIDKPGIYSSGSPLMPNRDWHRHMVRLKQLDGLAKSVIRLEREQT